MEERLLGSQGSSNRTGAHRSSSQEPSPSAVAKTPAKFIPCPEVWMWPQPEAQRQIVRLLKAQAQAASLSQTLLSADLSCGWRIGVGKTPGAPVATCCFRRNTACLTTQPRHSWRFCANVLVCLFVCVSLWVLSIQPLVFPHKELICTRWEKWANGCVCFQKAAATYQCSPGPSIKID